METVTFSTVMVWEECCKCGVPFGITQDHETKLRRTHAWFYCPNGHAQHYLGKTESEKKIERLEGQVCNLKRTSADLRERQAALPSDVRDAQHRARAYAHANAQRGAFWRGWDDRLCGREEDCCPYRTSRSGFRAAWFDGFGAEDPSLVEVAPS